MDLWLVFGAMVGFMSGMFVYARRVGRYDIVDVCWGSVIAVGAIGSWLVSGHDLLSVQTLATVLVLIWGARLSHHIAARLVKSDHEDPRYTELRSKWKNPDSVWSALTRIYLAQAALGFVIVLPVLILNFSAETALSSSYYLLALVWVIGFVMEVVADKQLQNFAANQQNKGKVMDQGVWKYSRHPNYFGELTQWWAIGAMSVVATGVWWVLVGPLLLTILIVFVSGLPPAERRAAKRKGWKEYRTRTSPLIPWFVK